MLSAIGSILVLGSATSLGFLYGEKLKKRTAELKEIQRATNQLQNEIIYTHTPLPEAIDNVAKKSQYPMNKVFKNISSILNLNEVHTVYEAFCRAFNDSRGEANLKEEDINVILDLAKTLGESDIDGQRRMFSLTFESLKKQVEKAENIMNKNLKMYRCLGLALGGIVVILFI